MNQIRGNLLRELRNKKKMTQDDLAKHLGFQSRTPITDMESGKDFGSDILLKLCELYDVEPNYILLYNEEQKANSLSQDADSRKEIKVIISAIDVSRWNLFSLVLFIVPIITYFFDKELSTTLTTALALVFIIGIISFTSDYISKTRKNILILHVPISHNIYYKHKFSNEIYKKKVKKQRYTKLFLTCFCALLYFLGLGIIGIAQVIDTQFMAWLVILYMISVYSSAISVTQYNNRLEFGYKDIKKPFIASFVSFTVEGLIFIIALFVITQSNVALDWRLIALVILQPAYIAIRLSDILEDIKFLSEFQVIERSSTGVIKRIVKFDIYKKQNASCKNNIQ